MPSLVVDRPGVGLKTIERGIAAALDRSECHGVLVYGGLGMGKSTLTRLLMDEGSPLPAPYLVQGAAGLADIPYGALAPYLEGAQAADLDAPLSVLRALVTFFRKDNGETPLVVIDDAHELDRDSAYLLAQLATAGTVKVIALATNGLWRSRDLPVLEQDGLLIRFDLQPLSIGEASRTCEQLLEGPIVRGALDYFAAESGGNPLFLRSAVHYAVRTQQLTRREGHWILLHEPLEVDSALKDLGESTVQALSTDERDLLDTLALAGAEPLHHLTRFSSPTSVRRLLDAGLIREDRDNPQLIGCHPPLYERIVRSLVPTHRSSELRRAFLNGNPAPDGAGARQQVRRLNWALDCGTAVEDPVLIRGARLASSINDQHSALRLATAVRGNEAALAARIETLRARIRLQLVAGNPADSFRLLEEARDPTTLERAAMVGAQLEVNGQARGSVLHALADSWTQLAAQLERGSAGPDDEPTPAAADILRATAWNLEGHYRKSEDLLRGLLGNESLGPGKKAAALSLLGEALGQTGRCDEGVALLGQALALAEEPGGSTDLLHFVQARHIALLVHSGDFDAAAAAIDAHLSGPIVDRFFSGGTIAALQAALLARTGDFTRAAEVILPAILVLRVSDREVMLPYAAAMGSWIAAVRSDTLMVERLAAEFELTRHRGSVALGLLGAAYVCLARERLAPSGRLTLTLESLAEVARTADIIGCEKDIVELLVLFGHERSATRLADIAALCEGGEARVLEEYATGVVTREPDRLIRAGDLAEEHRMHFVAVDASARALRLLREGDDSRLSKGVLRNLRRRRDALEHQLSLSAVAPAELRDLTGRELKIALQAAQGASNREIARSLTLSTRTVEGHLYRIYVKLGITRREELALVVESTSVPPSGG